MKYCNLKDSISLKAPVMHIAFLLFLNYIVFIAVYVANFLMVWQKTISTQVVYIYTNLD